MRILQEDIRPLWEYGCYLGDPHNLSKYGGEVRDVKKKIARLGDRWRENNDCRYISGTDSGGVDESEAAFTVSCGIETPSRSKLKCDSTLLLRYNM